jgi:hypothetical protein
MSNIKDIEKAIGKLTPDELTQFRIWFDEFEASGFDAKIERDAKNGKLDRLASEALADLHVGRTREL